MQCQIAEEWATLEWDRKCFWPMCAQVLHVASEVVKVFNNYGCRVPSFFDQLSRNRYTDNLSVADNLSGRCESYALVTCWKWTERSRTNRAVGWFRMYCLKDNQDHFQEWTLQLEDETPLSEPHLVNLIWIHFWSEMDDLLIAYVSWKQWHVRWTYVLVLTLWPTTLHNDRWHGAS